MKLRWIDRRHVVRHSGGSLCLLLLATACGRRAAEKTTAARWVADSIPSVDIPGTGPSGEVWLEQPVAAARLASGEIAVADGGAQSVLFFDARGRLIRRSGREGGGPGEYRHLMWLGLCRRDSLVAWDIGRSRIVVLDTAGTVVRHYAVPPYLWAVTCSRVGHVALVGWPSASSSVMVRGTSYEDVDVTVVAPTGVDTVAIIRIPLMEARFSPPPMPLAPVAAVALTAEHIYVGTPDTASVSVYSHAGQLEANLPVRAVRRRATDEQYEAAIEAFLDAYATPDWRTSMRQQLDQLVQKPEWLPYYGPLFADSLGRVWAQTSFAGDSTTILGAVGDRESRAAEIVVPRPLRVFEVGTDYVLGTYLTPGGEPHVVLYRFRPSGL